MATAALSEAAADQIPQPDQRDEVEVNVDVSSFIAWLEFKTADL
jgi:hypothetical protein